jgi:hypothetical protein
LDEDTMMTQRSMLAAAILAAICLGTAAGLIAAGGGDRATSQDVSIQSIRGIKGIDTVTLQNLEAVLRLQTREPPPPPGNPPPISMGGAETTQTDEPQPDARQQLTVDLEGS